MRIRSKLVLLLLAVGTTSLFIPSALAYKRAEQALREGVSEQLVSLRESKARHIESYMSTAKSNVELLAQDPDVSAALIGFRNSIKDLPPAEVTQDLEEWLFEIMGDADAAADALPKPGPLAKVQELYGSRNPFPKERKDQLNDAKDGSEYSAVHAEFQPFFRKVRAAYGFSDLILLDARTGISVYSVKKKADFATDFLRGPFRNMNGAEAVRGALAGSTKYADFENYLPNEGLPTAFIATPITVAGTVEGVILALIPIDEITKVMTGGGKWRQEGLGETGETFLVGPDMKMRSDSRFLTEDVEGLLRDLRKMSTPEEEIDSMMASGTSVLSFVLKSPAATRAISGKSGAGEFIGYRGRPIVAAYGSVDVPGLQWGIVCKREAAEALAPLRDIAMNSIFTFLGLFGVVSLISVAASQGLVRPLELLANAARSIGKGEKGVRVAIDRSDELGELAVAFNAMVADGEKLDEVANSIRRNIVHDLKTPVTVVKGMGETLLDPYIAQDPVLREEMAQAIVNQSHRLLDDLKDILAPINLHYVPEVEEFDLSILIENVVSVEKHTGRAAHHHIIVEGTDQPFIVTADRRKMRRVVENLVSNALKYSPGEGKKVIVKLGSAQAGMASVTVEDEGLGMTTEELYRVLTLGGRVADHALHGIEGTGLGLGSVKHILQAHGGELTASSEKGTGSSFTATFPIHFSGTGPEIGSGA